MGRRSYGGEKRRKELARKAKRDAKLERKQRSREGGEGVGGGPEIDWEARVGGETPPPEASDESEDEDASPDGSSDDGRPEPAG